MTDRTKIKKLMKKNCKHSKQDINWSRFDHADWTKLENVWSIDNRTFDVRGIRETWYDAVEVDNYTLKVVEDLKIIARSLELLGAPYRFEVLIEELDEREFKYSKHLDAYWCDSVDDWLDDVINCLYEFKKVFLELKKTSNQSCICF